MTAIVKFTVTDNMRRKNESGWMQLLSQSCGMRETYGKDMIITCRPDQFAKFIILRNEMGIANDIKGIMPEYIISKYDSSTINIDTTKFR